MTKVYFVRHAEPQHAWSDDRTRPLTDEGLQDVLQVTEYFKTRNIDVFFCSPYKRSIQTIEAAAAYFDKEIIIDERLRERKKGPAGDDQGMLQKRWNDKDFSEEGGESIHAVQSRNIAALNDILENNKEKTIVIGTHGTALSSILNHYDDTFDCDSFLRIIDWMPYIIELDFNGKKYSGCTEHLYVHKEFKGKSSVKNDGKNNKNMNNR